MGPPGRSRPSRPRCRSGGPSSSRTPRAREPPIRAPSHDVGPAISRNRAKSSSRTRIPSGPTRKADTRRYAVRSLTRSTSANSDTRSSGGIAAARFFELFRHRVAQVPIT